MLSQSCLAPNCGILMFLVAAVAVGQTNTAVVTAACGDAGVDLVVDLSITEPLPSTWVGWVVERMTIGPCDAMHRVYGLEGFPAGAGSLEFSDATAVPGLAYKYLILAVDDQGNRHDLLEPDFADPWTAVDYTTCGHPAVVRGSLHGDATQAWMFVCMSDCWEYISYVEDVPAGLAPYLNTGDHVELRGALHFGPSGPYITDITGWALLDGCATVTDVPASWSGAKARFR